MANKRVVKYNAAEVHITRCVAGLFLFGALIFSVWGVRHIQLGNRDLRFLYAAVAALFALCTTMSGWKLLKQRKSGSVKNHKIFDADYWFYIFLAGTIAHGGMLLALSENLRHFVQPVMYLLLVVMYLIYVMAYNLEKPFRKFSYLCGAASVLPMVHYQCFYHERVFEGNNPVPMVSADSRSTVGWLVLAAVALYFLWRRHKKGRSCWKEMGLLAILGLYWILLFSAKSHSYWISLGTVIAVGVYFLLLRILKQIRVIK